MLKIGEFSKLSRVSIRMLRHYDDIGLLKPAEIDDFTGYRYYREDQLFVIGRITALKDMGFALADIIHILEIYDDKDQLDVFFSEREKELLYFCGNLITFEIGLRFLADHLNGDVYFQTERENHNLDRARVQFKMVKSMEEQKDAMRRIVDDLLKEN